MRLSLAALSLSLFCDGLRLVVCCLRSFTDSTIKLFSLSTKASLGVERKVCEEVECRRSCPPAVWSFSPVLFIGL